MARREGSSLQQRRLQPAPLLANDFVAFTRSLLAQDGVLDVYVHSSGEPITVEGPAEGPQTLKALPIQTGLRQSLEDGLLALDGLLAVDVRLVSQPDNADVRMIRSNGIPFGSESETVLGLSIPHRGSDHPSWDVVINGGALAGDPAYETYTALHEIGHVFGEEHVFDGSDGDRSGSRSPWRSLYPDESVMAYRRPRVGMGWPQSYRRNDLNALASVWKLRPGAQLPLDAGRSSQLVGTGADDVLIGSVAADRLRGLDGDDLLIDGSGADRLEGGPGANVYRSEADRQRDLLVIQLDGKLDVVRSLGREDRLQLLGADAADVNVAITASDTSRYGTLPGIGVWVAGRLEVLVTDPSLQLEQVQKLTVVLPG